MTVAAMQDANQHIRSSLGFMILPKGTSTCRPGESFQQPSEDAGSTPEPQPPLYCLKYLVRVKPSLPQLMCITMKQELYKHIYIFTRWTRLPAVAYQCNPWNISKETLFTFRQLFLLPLYLYQSQAASIYLSGPKRSGVALMREYLTTQLKKKKKKQLGWNAGGKKRKRKMLLLITEGFLASF